jgi:hypothetical protein
MADSVHGHEGLGIKPEFNRRDKLTASDSFCHPIRFVVGKGLEHRHIRGELIPQQHNETKTAFGLKYTA